MKKIVKPRAKPKPRAAPKPKAAKPKKNPPRQVVSVKINIDNSKKTRGGASKGARGGGPQGLAPYTPPITTYPLFREDPPPPPILPPLAIERLRMQYPLLAAMANPVEETAMALRPTPPVPATPATPTITGSSQRRGVRVPYIVSAPAKIKVGKKPIDHTSVDHPVRRGRIKLYGVVAEKKVKSGEWLMVNGALKKNPNFTVIPPSGGAAVPP